MRNRHGVSVAMSEGDYQEYLESQRLACVAHGDDLRRAMKRRQFSWEVARVKPSSWVIPLYVPEGDLMRGSAMSDFTD